MKKRQGLIEIIAWIPVWIMTILILLLSSQDGQASYYTSVIVAKQLVQTSDISDKLNGIIRTMAHVSEYMVLSFLIGMAVTVSGIRGKLRSIYMVLLGIMVATVDEFYQIFIPDRYGDLKDIFCDGLGVVVVAAAMLILTYHSYKKRLDYGSGPRRTIIGVDIDNVTFDRAVELVMDMAKEKGRRYIVTPNVDHVVKLQNDKEFMQAYKGADLVVTDGTPLMWIAESYGSPFLEKIPGSDLMPRVCERAAKDGLSIFLCGGEEGVAVRAAKNLKRKYKKLKIVGTASPMQGFEHDAKRLDRLIKQINDASPDILVVSLGAPKQEKFIYNNKDRMNFGVALPVGAAIDFVAEEINRAPKWMRKVGLEWFYRFLQEPGRLFKRYFVDDMKIFWLAWKYRPSRRIESDEDTN